MAYIPQFLQTALNAVAGESPLMPFHFELVNQLKTGLTLAQVNAGFTLIPNIYSNKLIVTNFALRINSAAVGTGNLLLQTTETTPVVIATFANAQLSSGAFLRPGDTGVTLGAGFWAKLSQGVGIQLKTSAISTGAFTVDISLNVTPR